MFIQADNYFILMDVPNANGELFSAEALRALRDAGVRTTMMFLNPVDGCEPARGQYNWHSIDLYVERALSLGMKVMLPAYTAGPTWAPEHWCASTANGVQRGLLSPWSEPAQEWLIGHYERMVARYAAYDVAIVDTHLTHGETLFINEAAWFGPEAVDSYEKEVGRGARPCKGVDVTESWLKSTYMNIQIAHANVLGYQPAKLLYTALHPAIADFGGLYGNGNKWYPDLLKTYRIMFPDNQILWVLYTFAQWSYLYERIKALRAALGLHVFGGAEYAEGLPSTTPAAIAAGIDGQFIGPCHPFTGHTEIEPWMLDNIEKARKQWQTK